MANHKSSVKRARQDLKKRARNTTKKSAIKTFEKKLRAAINEKNPKLAQELLRSLSSKLDKAAKSGVIHFKQASRKISRLSSQIASNFSLK